jgi:hypothetical protein
MKRQPKPSPSKDYKEAIKVGVRVRIVSPFGAPVVGTVSRIVGNTQYAVDAGKTGIVWMTFPKAKEIRSVDGVFEVGGVGRPVVKVEVLKDERDTVSGDIGEGVGDDDYRYS